MIRHARAAGRNDLYEQLLKIRENFEPSLRRMVINPVTTTKLSDFLEHLDRKYGDWRDQIHQRDQRIVRHLPLPANRIPNPRPPRIQGQQAQQTQSQSILDLIPFHS